MPHEAGHNRKPSRSSRCFTVNPPTRGNSFTFGFTPFTRHSFTLNPLGRKREVFGPIPRPCWGGGISMRSRNRSNDRAVALLGAAIRGCQCEPDITHKHRKGVRHIFIYHDWDCPAVDAPSQIVLRRGA
jgi:hypothetical protein